MSSKQSLRTCHKTRIVNCKGHLLEPRERYMKWAYWCKDNRPGHCGWTTLPCVHQIRPSSFTQCPTCGNGVKATTTEHPVTVVYSCGHAFGEGTLIDAIRKGGAKV